MIKKLTFLADMSAKGGGGLFKKNYYFIHEKKTFLIICP